MELFRSSAKLGLFVLTVATVLQFPVGGRLGINETDYQPMKIAAAEANWDTCQPCSFSVIQIGGYNQDETPTKIIEIPHLLSILATGTWDGEVQGLSEVNAQYNQQYGPGYYVPNVFIQYWSMRVMAYIATLVFLVGLWGMFLLWRKKFDTSRFFLLGGHLDGADPVPDGHRRLAAHRERPATLDRAGPDADQGRAVRLGQRHPGGDQPGHRAGAVHDLGVIAAVLMVRHARRGLPDDVPDDRRDAAPPTRRPDRPTTTIP